MITCYFEDSDQPTKLRHVVVDTLVVKADKILLVKRGDDTLLEAGKWALPGGYLERDETAAEAATRETLEETGYQVKVEELFRLIDNPKRRGEDRQNVALVYLATPIKKVGQQDGEISRVEWFKLDALPPAEKIAFDHAETLNLYRRHLIKPLKLPLIGWPKIVK